MKPADFIIKTIVPALKNARPATVILGEKNHPRRIAGKFSIPDYMQRFDHCHQMPKFCCCLKGAMAMRVGDYDYRLQPRDLCVIGRNVWQCESFASPRTWYEVLWVFFSSIREVILLECQYRSGEHRQLAAMHLPVPGSFLKCFDAMLENRHDWKCVQSGLKKMGTLIQEGARKPHETYNYVEKEKRGYLHARMQKALLYIEDHSSEDIHLTDVAAYVGLNPDYLERQLHQEKATTFLKWLNSCRLKYALVRFNETNKTISEIAYECGFNDPFIFSRVFKRHFGLSPRQFRDKYSHKDFGA